MDFKTFIDQAWEEHVDAAQVVGDRLDEGAALVADEAQLNALMNLGHHVHGEHLGAWREGIAFLERVATLPSFDVDGSSGQALRRFVASLRLSQEQGVQERRVALDTLSLSDRIRVGAMAAANLVRHDTRRADQLLRDALGLAQRAGLPATDPMNRALAVTGNNLASALEEKPGRSAEERQLMILAAQTSRHYWGLAGSWLEAERAEYRLANTWLQAGDLARAREHAQACLEIVTANHGAALERLFGWEAMGLVERAAGNAAGHAQALAHARRAFAELDDADKAWCAASLEKLAA